MKPLLSITILVLAIAAFVMVEWRPWQQIEPVAAQSPAAESPDAASQVSENQVLASEQLTTTRVDVLVPRGQSSVNRAVPVSLSQDLIKAQLMPANYTTLVAEISGRVADIGFNEGEPFKEGVTLITFDCELQRAQLQRVTAEMAIAQRNALANTKLLARGAVSKLEADNAQSEFDRAQAQAMELQVLVNKCTIAAPYEGKVGERFVRPEQFVQAGEPLMDILDDSAMELEFIVPSSWIAWLNQGDTFDVEMEETQTTYPAVVSRMGARIDPVSRTIKVVGLIDGQFAELKPGMSGSIMITPPEKIQQGVQLP